MPNNAMETLLLRGAIFRTHIKIPSGRRKLNRDRLNLPTTIENASLVTSGQLILIPNNEMAVFQKIRAKASGIIEKYGVPMGSIGLLVPNERLDIVNEKLAERRNEFNEAVESLRSRYPEIKQNMLSFWNQEIISLAARYNTEEGYIFEVMRKVEDEFHDWDYFQSRFHYGWNEYHDINEMASAFIEDSVRSMLERMREFAESLMNRIRDENISERNIAPIRRWVESIGQAIRSFENERLNQMLESLEIWSEEGVADEVSENVNAANNMRSMLEDVIVTCNEHVDEIASESIAALTKQSRTIERRAG